MTVTELAVEHVDYSVYPAIVDDDAYEWNDDPIDWDEAYDPCDYTVFPF